MDEEPKSDLEKELNSLFADLNETAAQSLASGGLQGLKSPSYDSSGDTLPMHVQDVDPNITPQTTKVG